MLKNTLTLFLLLISISVFAQSAEEIQAEANTTLVDAVDNSAFATAQRELIELKGSGNEPAYRVKLNQMMNLYPEKYLQPANNGPSPYSEGSNTNNLSKLTPVESVLADSYEMNQNYPNPFNPVTTISFKIPAASYTTLKVYDESGKLVSVLVNDELSAGQYNVMLNGEKLSSGVYFYTLTAGNFVETKKMILVK